jgi:hypothetical protein
MSNIEVSKLSGSAIIVNLNLSVWTARKLDKQVSQEIDKDKATKTRAGNYHKNLLAGSGKLEEITKLAGAVRTWHYTYTQPWSDGGDRVLPMTMFADYRAKLNEYETQFGTAVNNFLNEYDTLVTAAAFQLGNLFNRDDYPAREHIVSKFGFRYSFAPLPMAGDFRVDIGEQGLAELRDHYEGVMAERTATMMKDAWDRLYEVVSKMSERLSDDVVDGEPKRKIFRDSLVDNAIEACRLLRHFNATNDTKLETMRRQLEDALHGVDAQSLRDSDLLREQTKQKVDALLDKFSL